MMKALKMLLGRGENVDSVHEQGSSDPQIMLVRDVLIIFKHNGNSLSIR